MNKHELQNRFIDCMNVWYEGGKPHGLSYIREILDIYEKGVKMIKEKKNHIPPNVVLEDLQKVITIDGVEFFVDETKWYEMLHEILTKNQHHQYMIEETNREFHVKQYRINRIKKYFIK